MRKETKAFVESTWNLWLDLVKWIFIVIIPSALEAWDYSASLGSLLHCWAVLMGKKVFLMARLNLSCSNFYLLPFILPPCTALWNLAPSSWWSPHRFWRAAVRCSEATSSLGRTSLVPSASLCKTNVLHPATNCLDGPLLTLLQLIKCLLCIGWGPKLDAAFCVLSNKSQVKADSHFPQFAHSAVVHTAQDAVGVPCCQGTLLSHAQLAVCQDPQVLFSWSAPQPGSPSLFCL